MPRIVSVREAKMHLSDLIARAEEGEDVIITRDGVPMARIVPVEPPISETITLMRRERGRRQCVSAEDFRTAKEHGRS